MEELREYEEQEPFWKGPFKIIVVVFLLFILVLMSVPYYGVKQNPSPSYIPTVEEVIPEGVIFDEEDFKLVSKGDYKEAINPTDPFVRQVATKISGLACKGNKVCQSKAIYYFVRDNFDYVSDPVNREYIETPKESLFGGVMDCDGYSVLLSTLQESIGVDAQLVFIPSHVYVRIYLPEATKMYKRGDWIYLDATCKNCDFGEISFHSLNKEESYLEVP